MVGANHAKGFMVQQGRNLVSLDTLQMVKNLPQPERAQRFKKKESTNAPMPPVFPLRTAPAKVAVNLVASENPWAQAMAQGITCKRWSPSMASASLSCRGQNTMCRAARVVLKTVPHSSSQVATGRNTTDKGDWMEISKM